MVKILIFIGIPPTEEKKREYKIGDRNPLPQKKRKENIREYKVGDRNPLPQKRRKENIREYKIGGLKSPSTEEGRM